MPGRPGLPVPGSDVPAFLRAVHTVVNNVLLGRMNCTGTVTLTASTTTTTVTDNRVAVGSVPILLPKTSNAAAELGNGTAWVSSVTDGSFVITHANNSLTDRDFWYIFLG